MKNIATPISRRRFVTYSTAVTFIAPAFATLGARPAAAEALPRLDEKDASASALQYVHDASKADPGTRGAGDRFCRNCRFYTDAAAAEWGPCTLFPGKAVSAEGWCTAWAARQS